MKERVLSITAAISRVLVGVVFIFSGFVKAVDPLGSTYKFIDYFNAFGMPSLEVTAFPLAILLSALEFTIGVCLILFIQSRWASWGALLFMIFFTPLTLWLAITNPVHDCGCFGDALVLTNWQTFYKNILILLLAAISFVFKSKHRAWLKAKGEWAITAVILLLIVSFSWYNYEHLPIIDFRPYKVGVSIPEKMAIPEGAPADIYEQYFTLVDTVSGKKVEVESNVYMSDSTYWKNGTIWKFISSSEPKLVKKGYQPEIHDFRISTSMGEDITSDVLSDTRYYFILVAYDLKRANPDHLPLIKSIHNQAIKNGYQFMCLTASSESVVEKYKEQWQIPYQFYYADPITLKTIIRANPGLLILHKGKIVAKWHHNDIPDFNTINANFLKL